MGAKRKSKRTAEIQEALLHMNMGCAALFLAVIGLPFILLGGFFVFQGAKGALNQVRLLERAVEVPAVIHSSRVVRPVGVRSGTSGYFAEIEYTYTYQERDRRSTRIWIVGERGMLPTMEALVDRFPADQPTTAWVDPDDPDVAFLDRRLSKGVYVSMCIGSLPFTFLTTLGLLVLGWRRPVFATMGGVGVSLGVVVFLVLIWVHFLQVFSAEMRPLWLQMILGASLILALSPLISLFKVRQLHRLYLDAQGKASAGPSVL